MSLDALVQQCGKPCERFAVSNHNQAWPYKDPKHSMCKARYTQVGSTLLSLSVNSDVALVYGGPSLDSQDNDGLPPQREYEASPVVNSQKF